MWVGTDRDLAMTEPKPFLVRPVLTLARYHNPVQVVGQLGGNIRLSTGWQSHHDFGSGLGKKRVGDKGEISSGKEFIEGLEEIFPGDGLSSQCIAVHRLPLHETEKQKNKKNKEPQ